MLRSAGDANIEICRVFEKNVSECDCDYDFVRLEYFFM